MNNSPKASRPRYQKIRELGHNREGGRVTYLAKDNATGQQVVIKQFQFAQSGAAWGGLKAYEREIQVLRSLNHPGIPRYLNSFESPKGFCMVQEYKDAQSLAVPRQWTPQEVKQIAISVLEILVDLQNRIPPVIHRDIKPENILIDEQMNVYLVDFGFARIGGGEGAMSSVATGTFGFMAPEQIYNRELSNATDLYGLGATLICLLTGTKSTAVETLMDDLGRFNFKPKLSKLNQGFVNWLEKMVQPKQKDRYASATTAQEALSPLSFNVVPEVHFNQSNLQVKATRLGETVTQTITVSNPIPKTVLKGSWEVAAHPSDPPHTPSTHDWISFTPASFKGNQVECSITVDTSNLIADKVYSREILLQTNSEPKTHNLTIEVQTASLASIKIPYPTLIVSSLLLSIFSPYIIASIVSSIWLDLSLEKGGMKFIVFMITTLVTAIGIFFGFKFGYRKGLENGLRFLAIAIPLWLIFPVILSMRVNGFFFGMNPGVSILLSIFRAIGFILIGSIFGFLVKEHREVGFSQKSAIQISTLATVLGSSLLMGLLLLLSFPSNPIVGLVIIFEMVGINWLRTMEIQQCKKLINEYRKSEPRRIQP